MSERVESLLEQMRAEMQEQTQVLRDLVSALAESDDGAEDELPSKYMDGTPCP